MNTTGKNTGNWGEEQAVAYLKANNYAILAQNWRFKHLEIDIVAQFKDIIVFVEVKTRSGEDFGEPETFVSPKKQRFIINAANQYLIEKNIDLEARFDIISILIVKNLLNAQAGKSILKHLPEAFYPVVK